MNYEEEIRKVMELVGDEIENHVEGNTFWTQVMSMSGVRGSLNQQFTLHRNNQRYVVGYKYAYEDSNGMILVGLPGKKDKVYEIPWNAECIEVLLTRITDEAIRYITEFFEKDKNKYIVKDKRVSDFCEGVNRLLHATGLEIYSFDWSEAMLQTPEGGLYFLCKGKDDDGYHILPESRQEAESQGEGVLK